jgi:hypothetical protein
MLSRSQTSSGLGKKLALPCNTIVPLSCSRRCASHASSPPPPILRCTSAFCPAPEMLARELKTNSSRGIRVPEESCRLLKYSISMGECCPTTAHIVLSPGFTTLYPTLPSSQQPPSTSSPHEPRKFGGATRPRAWRGSLEPHHRPPHWRIATPLPWPMTMS